MALDFPANPINGQAYGSYIYNSTVGAWQSKEDPATVATVSTTAPASANPGDLWYDSDDGTSYMYYDDGTSAQWVELLSSGLPLLNTKADLAGASFTGNVTAPRFISTQATGTAPLTVASTTAVTNLNADLLDGNHSTAFSPVAGSSSITTVGTITSGTWNGTTLAVGNGGTGTTTGTLSDTSYTKIVNPSGASFTTTTSTYTGALRVLLPVGMTNNMTKFNISVYEYLTGKSFDVVVAGYNYTTGTWINPTAYIIGNQSSSVSYTVRFGYTSGAKACIYIGETTSTWNYPQVAVNDVLVGYSGSSSSWLSGWIIDFVTAFENVTQTINNTQIVGGLVPVRPTSVGISAGSATISDNGLVTFSSTNTVRLNGVFTSQFTNYRLVYRGIATGNNGIAFQFASGGSSNATANYASNVAYWGSRGNGASSVASQTYIGYIFGHNRHSFSCDIMSPQLASNRTHLIGSGAASADSDAAGEIHFDGGVFKADDQFDGVSMFTNGTFQAGTIQVFGYVK